MNEPQISDESVKDKTGKDWDAWFKYLDAKGAENKSHKEIVSILNEGVEIDPWWQQMVTVTYEQARGLRKLHGRPDGFQISKSRTISADTAEVFDAWTDEQKRKNWIENPEFEIRKATPEKSLRITWIDNESSLDVYFYQKDAKTQVSLNHNKLPDEESAAKMKSYWGEQLKRLKEFLEE